MNSWQLTLYHHLPPFLRNIAASLRGFYLRSWRYGAETNRLVAEALERDDWTPSQWKQWQEQQLAVVLERAATRVPYYQKLWQDRRRRGDRSSWQYLENWPVLYKESLRQSPRAFIAEDCDPGRMFHEHTSGTTGKPLDLWWSKDTVRKWYALFEARCRLWHGVSRRSRWAILGGQLVTPVQRRRPPFWVWNAGLNQLYLSSYHLAPNLIPYYLEALEHYHIEYLLGYSSSLFALAQAANELNWDGWQMKVILTNAEPLYDYQRQAIHKAFHCPVRETYGMAEIVAAASECNAGRLHLWPEVGWVEVLDSSNEALAPGHWGHLVATGLINSDMPLIRYNTGDGIDLEKSETICSCQRPLPRVNRIEGRLDDMLYTADGRWIGRLDPVFKAALPLVEAQIIQEDFTRLRVRYVPAEGFGPETKRTIEKLLNDRLGEVNITFEELPSIPREPNGKFRAVICRIPAEQRSKLRQSSQ